MINVKDHGFKVVARAPAVENRELSLPEIALFLESNYGLSSRLGIRSTSPVLWGDDTSDIARIVNAALDKKFMGFARLSYTRSGVEAREWIVAAKDLKMHFSLSDLGRYITANMSEHVDRMRDTMKKYSGMRENMFNAYYINEKAIEELHGR